MNSRRLVVPNVNPNASSLVLRRNLPRIKKVIQEPAKSIYKLPKNFLTDIIRKAPPRIDNRPVGEYLHVSDLIYKCIRKISLIERNKFIISGKQLRDSEVITFAIGDVIHDFIKEKSISGASSMVYGNWECKCGKSIEGPSTFPIQVYVCQQCNTNINNYKEIVVTNNQYMIRGSPDLLFKIPEINKFYISEIKSMAGNSYDELERPLPDHVLQVVFYWFLMKEAGYLLQDQVSIFYVNKAYSFKNPYKEFSFDPREHIPRLNDMLNDALVRKKAKAGGKLPPRVVCGSTSSPEAKKCELMHMCFELPK